MVAWSVRGTHKAQEIKAVNKGLSDKGSPDSYESRVGLGQAAARSGRVRTGMTKTNHSDEREGHYLHLLLPIPIDFLLFSSASLAIMYSLVSLFYHCFL